MFPKEIFVFCQKIQNINKDIQCFIKKSLVIYATAIARVSKRDIIKLDSDLRYLKICSPTFLRLSLVRSFLFLIIDSEC